MSAAAITTLVQTFAAAGDIHLQGRDFRSGVVFKKIVGAHAKHEQENHISISIHGQWNAGATTPESDYLHPGYYAMALSHQVWV